ncbi:uncharacterized protein LOC129721501 [Wyeomyia smithii]|uniref:uncharacterized protein LOC129721501 n=1 Tax=Wyeomyia smithii TaxID=174621 RepID=UPI002467FF8F|nr:uncharacterized protein LOC129721501 [Wyeomyia smithii]
MNENLLKICRICLTEGSRHIFQKSVRPDALYNVSSLNRISEKLRYVTLLKIDEMENLPPMICDLCIVQLNVAYNFKRQATESDTKLRQYMIENGIDIMKDPLTFQPSRALNPPVSNRAIETNRVNQRVNSVSSSVLEATANTTPSNGSATEPRLLPIRIKVETSDAVEQSSNSTVSPLSTITQATDTLRTAPTADATVEKPTEQNALESSPSSSKGSFASSGRESTMVVVDSRNVSLQGDEDYVQTILGSNSSVNTCDSKPLDSVDEKPKNIQTSTESEKKVHVEKNSHNSDNAHSKRVQSLLAKLAIDMVQSSRSSNSKFRGNTRKKQQNDDIKQTKSSMAQHRSYPVTRRRHSLEAFPRVDSEKKANLLVLEETLLGRKRLSDTSLISPSKLRSLREKIREERGKRKEHGSSACNDSKRRRNATPYIQSLVPPGTSPSKARVS